MVIAAKNDMRVQCGWVPVRQATAQGRSRSQLPISLHGSAREPG